MISTRDLSELPNPETLRRLMQSLAVLGLILSPEEWQYRYYAFNSRWASGEQMGSMDNGQGDHLFALFNAAGCWLKGFAHESPMTPYAAVPPKLTEGLFEGVPAEFSACMVEPAFAINDTTFCIWRRYAVADWQRGPVALPKGDPDPDGSADLLRHLGGRPETYAAWAEAYFGRDVPLSAVRHIYAHRPLDQRILDDLSEGVSMADLAADLEAIGYPAARGGRR